MSLEKNDFQNLTKQFFHLKNEISTVPHFFFFVSTCNIEATIAGWNGLCFPVTGVSCGIFEFMGRISRVEFFWLSADNNLDCWLPGREKSITQGWPPFSAGCLLSHSPGLFFTSSLLLVSLKNTCRAGKSWQRKNSYLMAAPEKSWWLCSL